MAYLYKERHNDYYKIVLLIGSKARGRSEQSFILHQKLINLNGSQLGIILSSRDVWHCLGTFLMVMTDGVVGAGCYCYLVDTGQKCC